MAKRLSELYRREDLVEVKFGEEFWVPARVIGFQHPGVWVSTDGGMPWFVTNGRRIRHVRQEAEGHSDT
jgi:hypothetical protein